VIERDIIATLYTEHPAPSAVVKSLTESAGFKVVRLDQKSEFFAEIEAIKKEVK
jgi:glutathione synthase/RimK-type ligase-like ATP-grasp enzyme